MQRHKLLAYGNFSQDDSGDWVRFEDLNTQRFSMMMNVSTLNIKPSSREVLDNVAMATYPDGWLLCVKSLLDYENERSEDCIALPMEVLKLLDSAKVKGAAYLLVDCEADHDGYESFLDLWIEAAKVENIELEPGSVIEKVLLENSKSRVEALGYNAEELDEDNPYNQWVQNESQSTARWVNGGLVDESEPVVESEKLPDPPSIIELDSKLL